MKFRKLLSTATISSAIAIIGVVPAFADTNTTSNNTDVNVQVEATTMNVTVPVSLPITFESDGSNTTPENFAVTNNSDIAGIHIAKIEFDGENDWRLLPESADINNLDINSKDIKFSVNDKLITPNGDVADDKGSILCDENDFNIEANSSINLKFDIEHGIFTENLPSEKAFTMVTTFAFN